MDLPTAIATLSASPDHRVLRRVPDPTDAGAWPSMSPLTAPSLADIRYGAIIDTETTGTGDADEVIELAIQRFTYEKTSGQLVSLHQRGWSALRQPSIPIPLDSTRVHGITDDDVSGKVISAAEVEQMLAGVHLVIAHSAAFDRPKCEAIWPCFSDLHWACSLEDIPWREEGLSGRALDYLLFRQGWFYDGHRALADAQALLWLLTLPLPTSGRPALAALLETARKPVWEVRVTGSSYEANALLRARGGYRWQPETNASPKAWVAVTPDHEAETAWLRDNVRCDIHVSRVPPTRRFSGRV